MRMQDATHASECIIPGSALHLWNPPFDKKVKAVEQSVCFGICIYLYLYTYNCIRISTTVIHLDNKMKAVEQSICRSTTQLKHHHHCLHWHPSSILRSLQKKAEAAIVYVHEETKHEDISFRIIDYSCFGNTVHWPMHHLFCWTIVVAFQLDALCK